MQKFNIILIVVCSLLIVASGKNVTRFRVYVSESVSGPNATLYEVARANITADSPTSFGLVRVADDLVTSGPNMSTGMLGRAQGLVVNSGLTESATMLTVVFVFSAGNYQGSTITVLGLRPSSESNQEFPIIGGTAAFRMARGYVISDVYSYDPQAQNLVLFYDFYVYLNYLT